MQEMVIRLCMWQRPWNTDLSWQSCGCWLARSLCLKAFALQDDPCCMSSRWRHQHCWRTHSLNSLSSQEWNARSPFWRCMTKRSFTVYCVDLQNYFSNPCFDSTAVSSLISKHELRLHHSLKLCPCSKLSLTARYQKKISDC